MPRRASKSPTSVQSSPNSSVSSRPTSSSNALIPSAPSPSNISSNSGPGTPELKAYLAGLSVVDLHNQILELYRKIPAVKTYFTTKLTPGGSSLYFQKCYDALLVQIDPNKVRGLPKFSKIRKILADAQLNGCTPDQLAELMVLVVEKGLALTDQFELPESYYDGIYHMYERLCKHVVKHQIQTRWKDRCENAIRDCDVGYGLCELWNVFKIYFP